MQNTKLFDPREFIFFSGLEIFLSLCRLRRSNPDIVLLWRGLDFKIKAVFLGLEGKLVVLSN